MPDQNAVPICAVAPQNAFPVLHQIRHALAALAAGGAPTIIDLHTLPFNPADAALLQTVLGSGEVSARVDALGPTLIQETAYTGVWLVDYQDTNGKRLAWQLEIAAVPQILCAQSQDLRIAAERLAKELANFSVPAVDHNV